jgi:hypothetical protein
MEHSLKDHKDELAQHAKKHLLAEIRCDRREQRQKNGLGPDSTLGIRA